jgi:AcrR family transcriptional regulator
VPTAAVRRRPRPPGAGADAPPTREVILDTAERLFAARGVDGVAVRDLAAEMGITASSLYNHFPGKQALYEAVLARGLGPIVDTVAATWRDGLSAADVRRTLDVLVPHLAAHPHLAALLQRALLEESPAVRALLARWVGSLYREGLAAIRTAARDAGWSPEELPHLAIALFGMIFAYFTNAAGLRGLAPFGDDALAARALAVQRRVLERAILRLLAPRRAVRGRRAS